MNSEAAISFPSNLSEASENVLEPSPVCVASPRFEDDSVEMTDERLLEVAGRGEKRALAVLFRRHGRSVFNVAYRILKDEGEADDLRQDTFLYLFQKAHLYDPSKSTASSWIIQIAYHRAIDRKRFLSSRNHYKTEDLEEQRFGSVRSRPSTDHIDGKAILERLRNELSSDQQQTLDMHFFEGYTFKEIADKSGQSVGNVRHHYYRALDRLRSSLFTKKRG